MSKTAIVVIIAAVMALASVASATAGISDYRYRGSRYEYRGMQSPDFYPSQVEQRVAIAPEQPQSRTYGVPIQMRRGNVFSSIDHEAKRRKYALILQKAIEFRKTHLGTVHYTTRLRHWIEKYSVGGLTSSQSAAEEAPMSEENQAAMSAMEAEALQE